MSITTYYDTKLPRHLRTLKEEIEGFAHGYGLDFYETIFEVIDADDWPQRTVGDRRPLGRQERRGMESALDLHLQAHVGAGTVEQQLGGVGIGVQRDQTRDGRRWRIDQPRMRTYVLSMAP